MSRKPSVLDTFTCQGGAAWGYRAAGMAIRTVVDIYPQPRNPFSEQMIVSDAIGFIREHGKNFDFIHASPVCRRYSATQRIQRNDHPDQIADVREALESTGRPWVIENVEGAREWMRNPVVLCGSMFPGLNTYRHRLFESGGGFQLLQPEHPEHTHPVVKMGRPLVAGDYYHAVGNFSNVDYVRNNMGVPWMNRDGIRECIPPAYTEWVGRQFIKQM